MPLFEFAQLKAKHYSGTNQRTINTVMRTSNLTKKLKVCYKGIDCNKERHYAYECDECSVLLNLKSATPFCWKLIGVYKPTLLF